MGPGTADPFELLGLPAQFEFDKAELEARQRELSKVFHPDRYTTASASDRRAALNTAIAVNEAVRALKNPVVRGELLLRNLLARRAGVDAAAVEVPEVRVSPALLMEVMEWREELSRALTERDAEAVQRVAAAATQRQRATLEQVGSAFASLDRQVRPEPLGVLHPESAHTSESAPAAPFEEDVKHAQLGLATLKYLLRLTEEVRRIQEEIGE